MKVKCMLDRIEYKNKPDGKETGYITNRLANEGTEIEIEELSKKLIRGCTFKPSFLIGKKEIDWQEQQLFALDFDDGTTIQEELDRCKKLNILPCFGYTSFSHTEENHRFRLVFCNKEIITDYDIANKLQLILISLFNNCDEKCKNLSRLYFGGRNLIYEGYNNRINYKDLFEKYPIIIEEKTPPKHSNIKGGEKSPHNNNNIYNNTYIIVGTKTPLDNNYNIKAIANREVDYLKNKINSPHIVFKNNQEFCDYIFKEINLADLLEIKYPASFRCIFHEDNKPSAGIFQNEEGYWIYHCFGCGVSYNLLGVIEVLGKFKSRPKAYKFIRKIFNLEIQETEWQKEQKQIIDDNLRTLDTGEFEIKCPTAYKNIKSNIKYLRKMLYIAKDNVYNDKLTDNEDNVLFYASTRYICKLMGMSEESAKEISKKTTLFCYHNLINKVDDSEANEDMLNRSKAIGVNSDNKKYKHVNYFSIPSFNNMLFPYIEQQGIKWKENNYTMKGLSREMFYRAEGKEVADKLYPQYKKVTEKGKVIDRTTTVKSNNRTELISIIIYNKISEKGYVTEKEIVDELITNEGIKITRTEAEKQLKKSLKEIIDTYDFKRIRCNKEIKDTYRVAESGYPFIIVKN